MVEVVRTDPSKGAVATAGDSKCTWAAEAHAIGRRAKVNKQRICGQRERDMDVLGRGVKQPRESSKLGKVSADDALNSTRGFDLNVLYDRARERVHRDSLFPASRTRSQRQITISKPDELMPMP